MPHPIQNTGVGVASGPSFTDYFHGTPTPLSPLLVLTLALVLALTFSIASVWMLNWVEGTNKRRSRVR